MNESGYTVEHMGLPAQDPVRLKDWYGRVLQARLVYASPTQPPAFFLELPGGLMLEIYRGDSTFAGTGENGLTGWRHLALRVDQIESACEALTARGAQFTDPIKPAGGGGRVRFFRDAEGNLLHLVERPRGTVFDR